MDFQVRGCEMDTKNCPHQPLRHVLDRLYGPLPALISKCKINSIQRAAIEVYVVGLYSSATRREKGYVLLWNRGRGWTGLRSTV